MIPYNIAEQINHGVNSSTIYFTDMMLYGKPDFWEIANGRGDCEDYALAKRKKFLDMGYSPSELRLATCITETGVGHAVLIVTTEKGEYVLDNRYEDLMDRQGLDYTWINIEEGGKWHAILS